MKASCICLGSSLFSCLFLVELTFLKGLENFFLIFIGVLENLQLALESEFHSFGLNVAYGEEDKIFISNNTSVLIIVQKYHFATH